MVKRAISIALTALAVLFVGCTPKPPGPTTSVSATPIATAAVTSTPVATSTPIATPTPVLTPTPTAGVTENRIGYVRKAYTSNGKNYIDIDYVQFLTGQAAIDAAKADGIAEQDEHGNWYVPNDYYIVNDSSQLRTFEVSSTAAIKLDDGSAKKSITFAKLKSMGPTFDDGEMLMHCKVVNGIVTSLIQQFVP